MNKHNTIIATGEFEKAVNKFNSALNNVRFA